MVSIPFPPTILDPAGMPQLYGVTTSLIRGESTYITLLGGGQTPTVPSPERLPLLIGSGFIVRVNLAVSPVPQALDPTTEICPFVAEEPMLVVNVFVVFVCVPKISVHK